MEQIPVWLTRCSSYHPEPLLGLLQESLDKLLFPTDLSGKTILLKPNLISSKAPKLACSNPYFVATVAKCLLARGARLRLGDSPAFGSAKQVLKKQGFMQVLSGLEISVIEFSKKTVKKLACGVSVSVAVDALTCDYFVNLPRIKAHQQMGLTMALKNVFGIVCGPRKAWLHMTQGGDHQGFAEIILDLCAQLPPGITIADGITVMTNTGPVNGDPFALGCVALADNFVALDRALLEVLGIKKESVPLALAAQKRGLPGAVLDDIVFPDLAPDSFAAQGFSIPETLSPIRFQLRQFLKSSMRRSLLRR